ncbi:MAG TPA: hypothetical protein VML54_07180, partial [Candidatus Limnocylindrales bacterium]|nr:hypothetical protein [Candidatus Limnocylindrales bacterium]
MRSTRARATAGLAAAWIAVALLLWVWGALGGPGPVLPVPGETAVLAVDPDHAPEYMLSLWLHWDPPDRTPAWAVLEAGARWSPAAELQWRRRIHPGWNQLIWPTLPPIPAGATLALRVVEGQAASWALGEVRLSDGYRAAHLV